MTLQANCADDKEQWVQLLQDGISTVAGSTYIHTSHESLRYTHTLTCYLSAALIPYEPSMNLCVCVCVCVCYTHRHTHTHKSTCILSASSFHSSVSSVTQWSEKPQVPHLKHVHG